VHMKTRNHLHRQRRIEITAITGGVVQFYQPEDCVSNYKITTTVLCHCLCTLLSSSNNSSYRPSCCLTDAVDSLFDGIKHELVHPIYTYLSDRRKRTALVGMVKIAGVDRGQCLRSENTTNYCLPRLRTKFGERALSYAGSAAWNKLPQNIRASASLNIFKRKLKTHLFTEAFN